MYLIKGWLFNGGSRNIYREGVDTMEDTKPIDIGLYAVTGTFSLILIFFICEF